MRYFWKKNFVSMKILFWNWKSSRAREINLFFFLFFFFFYNFNWKYNFFFCTRNILQFNIFCCVSRYRVARLRLKNENNTETLRVAFMPSRLYFINKKIAPYIML